MAGTNVHRNKGSLYGNLPNNSGGRGSFTRMLKVKLEEDGRKNLPERRSSHMKYSTDRIIYGETRNNLTWLKHKI